jgi:hypothetical protein
MIMSEVDAIILFREHTLVKLIDNEEEAKPVLYFENL